jgi:hypothetical protein
VIKVAVPDKILEYIREKQVVSISDVSDEFNISRVTAMNYLSRLTNLGLANRIGYGKYEYGKSNDSSLIITPEAQRVIDLVERFGEKNILVWSINMLSNYSHYAIGKDLFFVETNSAFKKSVRDILLQSNYDVILDPVRRDFRDFSLNNRDKIFVISRKEKYGIKKDEPIIPTAERIWVDLYYYITRKDLNFSSFELGVMLGNMMNSNVLNYDRLLYYSNRRKIRDEIIIILYELIKKTNNEKLFNLILKGKNTVSNIDQILEGAIEQ